jgi:hypothetical protein
MRSYTYSAGKWEPCKDILPPTASSTLLRYHPTEAERRAWDAYRDALEQAGFAAEAPSRYTCRFGTLTVYARDHATLAQTRKQTEFYDFLCVLRLGGMAVRVWVDSLPNLFLFFCDVDARPVDETLRDFLTDDSFQKMISNVAGLADQMWEGRTRIKIEVEPPE